MKIRFTVLILTLLVASGLVPRTSTKAQEVNYVAAAVAALQTSNIYVHPGTPGTDYNTPNELIQLLRNEDNVVLVMLPPDASANEDILAIAKKISIGLNNQKTIGLAIGNELVGFSTLLPEGVAYDLMKRADDVSSNPVGTLITFSQNVHTWLSRNELPTPTPTPAPTATPRPTRQPIELPTIDTSSTGGKVSIGLIALLLFVVTVWLIVKLAPVFLRHSKFTPASNSLLTNDELLSKVENRQVVTELGKALKLALGLIDIYRASSKYTGIGEDIFPVMLGNMTLQLQSLIDHESGEKPLQDQYEATIENLLNYDDLFRVLQKNDPKAIELMAANYNSKNTMISHIGYLPTKSK